MWLDCCGHNSTCVVDGRCCCGDPAPTGGLLRGLAYALVVELVVVLVIVAACMAGPHP